MEYATTTTTTVHQNRSPVPTPREHLTILMERHWRMDVKRRKVWAVRLLLAPLLWGMYMLSSLLQGTGNTNATSTLGTTTSIVNGTTYRMYPPQDDMTTSTVLPTTWRVAVNYSNIPATAVSALPQRLPVDADLVFSATPQNLTDFCMDQLDANNNDADDDNRMVFDHICIDWQSLTSFHIYYGGNEMTLPFDPALLYVQQVLQSIVAAHNTSTSSATITQLQRIPTVVERSLPTTTSAKHIRRSHADSPAPRFSLVLPGAMLVLASAVALQFVLSPVSTDKFKDVVRSFQLVGVDMRTYLYSWIVYLSLQGIFTALILTVVSIVWNIFSQSSGVWIFLAHWAGMVHTFTMVTVLVQYAQQQETVASVPWLLAIASLIVGGGAVVVFGPTSLLLYLLGIVSPFVSMVQYSAIFMNYDVLGFNVGIPLTDGLFTLIDSGLALSFVTQLLGILLWNGGVWYASRPPVAGTLHNDDEPPLEPLDPTMFEDETPSDTQGDVLLRVRSLGHRFAGSKPMCGAAVAPNTVLRDLNLTIRRGEVFGYLGHNSSGKTTSIKILSGELPLQAGGVVEYHLSDNNNNGSAPAAAATTMTLVDDMPAIRRRIGICPQHNDALHGDASCRDYLQLFARLKGGFAVREGQTLKDALAAEVQRRIDDIAFTSPEDADKLIDTYSGGMKRKVCIAMAFLCDPEVVFLDEPSAGIDPYNRRIVWDMIINAKKDRSIILTTHFLDEADILSDRVGILKGGRLVACGSSLFLKHTVGGYKLTYDSKTPLSDTNALLSDAELVEEESDKTHHAWKLKHGCESEFPQALRALEGMGATNVSLELTSLEQVFLETGKEGFQKDNSEVAPESDGGDPNETVVPEITSDLLKKLWEPKAQRHDVSTLQKLMIVAKFMFSNAWKMKGSLFLNIIQPLIYLVVGFVVVAKIDDATTVGQLTPLKTVPVTPAWLGGQSVRVFGVGLDTVQIGPLNVIFTDEPDSLDYFLDETTPVWGGYYAGNSTLQYNEDVGRFSKQTLLQFVGSILAVSSGETDDGFSVTLNQVPHIADALRSDVLLLPMMLAFGFTGIIFAVLDLLLLKGYNVVSLFRVTGITEFMVYLGVLLYKILLTFVPFFFLSIILGNAMGSALFGNGGRWLATILNFLAYCYSTAPLGALIAKKFIKSDFKTAASVFPGIYLTVLSLPYIAWNIAYQLAENARSVLQVVGDLMSLLPPIAFQRCIGAILELSPRAEDDNVTWGRTWRWGSRVLLPILEMLLVGTIEWYYLRHITVERPPTTKLKPDEKGMDMPSAGKSNFGVTREEALSKVDDAGMNARELVKLFRVKPEKGSEKKDPYLKAAVKGVSFSIKSNSIMAVVGPNGAGKSTAMGVLAAEHTAEHGSLALQNQALNQQNRRTDHLFDKGNVAFCPQFDALFPKKTVREHLEFYASVRGIDTAEVAAQEHIDAIVGLLGLEPHLEKLSTDISGGYKRRTCLAIAMIGYPALMMVDECTTGLDPGARHLVWRVMRPNASENVVLPAILLSTHYMDEAARLGDKIAMFVDGEIMSVGSLHELKEEFCNSYFVEVSLATSARPGAQDSTLELFEREGMPAVLYESLPSRFKLQVVFQDISRLEQLARIFELLQNHRESCGIQFFAVSPMSLEQIFIDLSRRQFAGENGSSRMMSSRNLQVLDVNDVESGLGASKTPSSENGAPVDRPTEHDKQHSI